ncbi:hypothetical protein [Legionella londiniensis]|uniref:hypothetical protein n=1 Tax=Legionella londiniensis TaxID=45068 RepID=UPI00399D4C1B
MGKISQSILQPEKSKQHLFGSKNTSRTLALVVNSPYETEDSATSYKSSSSYLQNAGFTVINKKACTYGDSPEDIHNKIKPLGQKETNELTAFFYCHGVVGWFFGQEGSHEAEMEGAIEFARYIRAFEQRTGMNVKNIVLSGCYTAVELFNREEGLYINSSARLLSMLLPAKNIVGFLGHHADAKVTHVYKKNDSKKKDAEEYVEVKPNVYEASVVFRDGNAIEKPKEELYCDHKYTKLFVEDSLKLGPTSQADIFKPALVKEELKENKYENWILETDENIGYFQEQVCAEKSEEIKKEFSKETERANLSSSLN